MNMADLNKVNIKKEINKVMERKSKEILEEKKDENVILKILMEGNIDDYSVDELRSLFNNKGGI